MNLSKLRPASGSTKKRKRIARGPGSGHGGTSTRGHKGAKARSGFKSKRGHEGGQMPLQMRLPKRGFKNTHRRYKTFRASEYVTFNLADLVAIAEKYNLTAISPEVLYNLNLVAKTDLIKVLGDGELKSGLEISAHRYSKSAKAAITAAGSTAYVLFKSNQLQGIAEAGNLETVGFNEVAQYFNYIEEGDKLHVVAEGSLKTKFNLHAHKIEDAVKDLVKAQGGAVEILA